MLTEEERNLCRIPIFDINAFCKGVQAVQGTRQRGTVHPLKSTAVITLLQKIAIIHATCRRNDTQFIKAQLSHVITGSHSVSYFKEIIFSYFGG